MNEPEESSANLGLGYNISVLFMVSMPFLLVVGFSTALYRAYRKQNPKPPSNTPP